MSADARGIRCHRETLRRTAHRETYRADEVVARERQVAVPLPLRNGNRRRIDRHRKLGVVELKVAMMLAWPAAEVTLQVVAVPVQPPDHPTKALPWAAAAVSVTAVPEGNVVPHVDPQLIPAGVDVTVPEPVPARNTVRNGPLTMRFTAVCPRSSSLRSRYPALR